MARRMIDWLLEEDRPAAIGDTVFGLACRHYCFDNNIAPTGKFALAADDLACARGASYISLEDIVQAHQGVTPRQASQIAATLRRQQASLRRKARGQVAAKQKATKAAARKAKRAAKQTA